MDYKNNSLDSEYYKEISRFLFNIQKTYNYI